MILRPAPVSTETLTFDATANLLVGEASSLRPFERVYDDACDVGLTLISHRTGREVVYAVNDRVTDREGDVAFWDLKPADHRNRSLPVLRVFND